MAVMIIYAAAIKAQGEREEVDLTVYEFFFSKVDNTPIPTPTPTHMHAAT